MNGFDGHNPITGATIEYTTGGDISMIQNLSSSDPTSVTLDSLMPFTNYTISVSLTNALGTGSAVTIQVQTRSMREFLGSI
jgi:hypothetical protein